MLLWLWFWLLAGFTDDIDVDEGWTLPRAKGDTTPMILQLHRKRMATTDSDGDDNRWRCRLEDDDEENGVCDLSVLLMVDECCA